jgi:hypothetical protein
VEPRPEAQRALVTLFTPTASETDVLDALQWMVGSPEDASRVWQRFENSRAPAAAASQMAAARSTPVQYWWSPPGDVPYLIVQGLNDEAAPVENGHLLKRSLANV